MSENIRLDIQGLRAVSVFFVLLFHLWRREFPVGFLGVDVFFVISGYLMFSIMSKVPTYNCKIISMFYFRRIRRLVPIYLFTIFWTLVIIYILLPTTEFAKVVSDSKSALIFTSNVVRTSRYTYFDLVSSYFSVYCRTSK
jgi:peptidoglycan/LPS O-acetylase OafA/YrhL